MRDQGLVDRPGRVDMKAAALAADAGRRGRRRSSGRIAFKICLCSDFANLEVHCCSRFRACSSPPATWSRTAASNGRAIARPRAISRARPTCSNRRWNSRRAMPRPGSRSARSREKLGDRERAVAAYRQARAADPDDRHGALMCLMRLGAADVRRCRRLMCARCSIIMRRLSIEALVGGLSYRAPALLRDAVERRLPERGPADAFRHACSISAAAPGSRARPFARMWIGWRRRSLARHDRAGAKKDDL